METSLRGGGAHVSTLKIDKAFVASDELQGYLVSQPLDPNDCERLLREAFRQPDRA